MPPIWLIVWCVWVWMSLTLGICWVNLGFMNNYKEPQLWLVLLRYNADVASAFPWVVIHCLTHACLSHLTQLKLTPHDLWISESLSKIFFFPSHPHSVWTSNMPLLRICLTVFFFFFFFFFFLFSFFLLTLTASWSQSHPLCSVLCFSASSVIDSFLLILILITWLSFFHLIIFSVLFFFSPFLSTSSQILRSCS